MGPLRGKPAAGRIRDEEFTGRTCADTEPPALALQPHAAALGIRFVPGDALGERDRGGAMVAQHGSWNRSSPVGYRVVFIPFEDGRPGPSQGFAEGWLDGIVSWGRPVDVLFLGDGSMLVSDDRGDAVYRISRTPAGADRPG